ncbi:MAG TPA: ATP-binding protein [Longimicrobiaceae bacterium]|nr:ATP-binding protein [Longimicrobiaceae bacterium]
MRPWCRSLWRPSRLTGILERHDARCAAVARGPRGTPFPPPAPGSPPCAGRQTEATLSDTFDFAELFTDFRDEARDQLATLDAALSAVEGGAVLEAAQRAELQRDLHTLKGNAGMLGLRPLQVMVHGLESVLKHPADTWRGAAADLHRAASAIRRAVEQAGTPGQDAALDALGAIRLPPVAAAAPIADPAVPPDTDAQQAAVPEASAPAESSPRTARDGEPEVETGADASPPEGHAEPTATEREATATREDGAPDRRTGEGDGEALSDASGLREEVLRVPFVRLDAMLNEVGEVAAAVAALEQWGRDHREALAAAGLRRSLADRTEALATALEAARRSAGRLRTVPVARVFGRFPPVAAELARAQGKRVQVVMEGEHTELDKSTADALLDPLLHLVRNAVDHGAERPEEREAAGKDPVATLWLRAVPEGDTVRIEVEDDGRGLDEAALLRRGRELGWVGRDEDPGVDALAELVFRSGFSTRREVTEVSGRGVGLDVVRTVVERLRGSVGVSAAAEGGTCFVLRLPLTVALVPVLFLESAGQVLDIPATDVEEATGVDEPQRVGAAETVLVRGEALPLVRPSRLFGWGADGPVRLAVVVRRGSRGAAIHADRLLEQRPAFVRPLPAALGESRGVSGATLDAAGNVVLLLDAAALMDLNVETYRESVRGR